jgi:hypothetical protein
MAGTEILIGLAISAATSVITSALTPKQKLLPVDKGRFDDIRIQGSEYGTSIPIIYGRARLAGNIIWSDGVQPWVTTTPGRSGGKFGGGGGQPAEPPTNNYSYTTNLAIAICEGEIKGGLKRIWENAKVTVDMDGSPLSGTAYQAESSLNTFTGGAVVVRDLSAENEYKVQFIGTSSLLIPNVYVPQTGTYSIKISYSAQGDKSALMKLDGGSNEVVNFPSTGSSSIFASVSISKSLTEGTHTILFSNNGSNLAPMFDAVAVNGAGVALTPTSVTGLIDPDATFPTDINNPSDYYNARLIADGSGTATARISELSVIPADEPIPTDPPEFPAPTTPGGSTTAGVGFTFYSGSETQLPDPLMMQIDGADRVPAYRGISYLTYNKYQIPDGQMPNFTFEVDEGTHDLADIVTALWKRVGLEDAQLDVASLAGTFVEGLVIQSRTPLSDILDVLQITFAFDFVDLNGKVTAVRRGSSSIVTIPVADLKAYEDGSEVPVAELEGTYINVEELPKQVDVSYLDRSKDYHTNVQPALMQIGFAEEPQTLVLPIVLSADQAHEVGMRVLNTVYLQRVSYAFTLPPKYSYLSPTDVVTIETATAIHKLRITQFQNGLMGLCKVQASPDSASLYAQISAGDTGSGTEVPPIQFPANTELVLMDIPPLYPDHTGFGFYAAACGRGTGNWYGAHLYREEILDSGSYERIGGFEVAGTIGTVLNSLLTSPSYTDIGSGNMVDTSSSITVQLLNGTLESFTSAELFQNDGLNLCYIGGELVQFATASAVSPAPAPYIRQYTLTNFRRGVNGTTSKIGIHMAGEQFVYMNNAVKFMREQSSQLYLTARYKAVSVGQPFNAAVPVTFITGNSSAPPVATNFTATQIQTTSPEGIALIAIRGSFKFGYYVGGQRAKVFVRRPLSGGGTEPTFFNTGIIVTPDANNDGSFEIPAAVNGTYVLQVVTISPYDLQAPSGHPQFSIDVSADNPVPATPTAPVPNFDGQTLTWSWTATSDSRHAYYQVFNGVTNVILPDATRVDGNSYSELPVNGIQRKIRSVSNQGTPSALSPAGTFTVPAPAAPSNYSVIFDGYQLIHSWTPVAGMSYEIGDSTFAVIGTSQTGQWLETTTPNARSVTRYLRAKQYGVPSSWTTGITLSLSAPSAPDSVSFVTSSATPFDVPVLIVKPTALDRRYVRRTVVEVLRDSDNTVLNTLNFEGIAESALISGRFANSTDKTIRVRAHYEDFFGAGASATTASSYTFPAVGDTDIVDPYILGQQIRTGVVNTASFASSIRPIEIYSGVSLPTLPNAAYPLGATIFWTVDNKQYQNRNNMTWSDVSGATDFTDLTGTISAGQIGSGTISDNHLNATANFTRIVQSGLQASWSGGGDITWQAGVGLTWTARFISLPNALSSDGYFHFSARTVVLSQVWDGLFRRVHIGGVHDEGEYNNITPNQASAGYFIAPYTNYTSTNTLAPTGYVDYLIAYVNGDTSTGTANRLILWDGRIINSGQTIQGNTSVPNRSIVAEQIVAATITSAELKAGSITAEKLAIGLQTGNLVANSSFESGLQSNGVPEGWTAAEPANTLVITPTIGVEGFVAKDGSKVLKLKGSFSNNIISRAMLATAGDTYLIRASIRGTSANNTYFRVLHGTTIDSNGYLAPVGQTDLLGGVTVPNTWGQYGTPAMSPAYYTVPSGMGYIALQFYNYTSDNSQSLYIDDIVVTKQFGSTYIQNGAITTDLIAAHSVRAQNIQIGTFSESLQLNSKFIDGLSGYYDFTTNPLTSPFTASSDGVVPSEWTGISAVPVLVTPATDAVVFYGNWIPLDVNDTYYIEVWAKASVSTTVYLGLNVDSSSAFNSGNGRYFQNNVTLGTTWTKLAGTVGKNAQNSPHSLKWTDQSAYNDGSATMNDSKKFRFVMIGNYPTGSANIKVAQVTISRMETGNLIVNGAITTQHMTAGSIDASILTANTIVGAQIQAGAIGADQIAARAIRADKIAIGVITDNLISNSSFEGYDTTSLKPDGWEVCELQAGTPTWESSTDFKAEGNRSIKMQGSGNNFDVSCLAIPVVAGQKYVVRAKLYSAATAGNYSLFIDESNSAMASGKLYVGESTSPASTVQARSSYTFLTNTYNGATESLSGTALSSLSSGGTFKQKECEYTVPAGVKYISVVLRFSFGNAPLYADDVTFQKEMTGVIIQDGTLTGNKLVANTITGGHIAAGTITAQNLIIGGISDNLLSNPSFEELDTLGFPATWQPYSSTGAVSYNVDTQSKAVQLPVTKGVTSRIIPVTPSTKLGVRLKIWGGNSYQSTVACLFRTTMPTSGTTAQKEYIGTGSDGTSAAETTVYLSTSSASNPVVFTNPLTLSTSTGATPSYYEGVVTVPAGKYWMSFVVLNGTTGTVYIDEVAVRTQTGSAFISDLRADQLVANTGQIGLVFSDQIRQNSYKAYQAGSFYDRPSDWDYTNGNEVSYDADDDALVWTGSSAWNTGDVIYSQTWQLIHQSLSQTINGYFEFAALESVANKLAMGGLVAASAVNPTTYGGGSYYQAFDYAWHLSQSTAYIYEAGVSVFNAGTFVSGDLFRVGIEEGYVKYRKNGKLIYTSPYTPNGTGTRRGYTGQNFRGMVMFGSVSGTQTVKVSAVKLVQEGYGQGWRLNPLTGTSTFNQEPNWVNSVGTFSSDIQIGNIATKTSGSTNAWDTSRTTEQTIAAGDGWFQVTVATVAESMIGLSSNVSWTNPSYTTLNYAIYLIGGAVQVYENGTQVGSAPSLSYVSGDTFRVGIEGETVKYRKNGVVFFESLTYSSLVYPLRGKVCLKQPNDSLTNIAFTASSSGSGEFNSGITVRGTRLEDLTRLVTTSIRGDARYRGNDYTVPSNNVTSITYTSYYISYEDDLWFANLSVNVSDYKSNSAKNMDSLRSCRTRVYNRYGAKVAEVMFPWSGRGVVFSGFVPRAFADMKQEAVFEFSFENLYGFSSPIYYSEAGWLTRTADTWIEAPQGNNLSYSPPLWFNPNDIPSNLKAVALGSDSVKLTWTNALNYPGTAQHDVYIREFKASGYESSLSFNGWTPAGNSTTSQIVITGLKADTRYETMVQSHSIAFGWSSFTYVRTYSVQIATSTFTAPSALSASNATSGQIALSWNTNNATGYTKTEIFYVAGTGTPTASDTQLGTGFTGTPTGSTTHTGLANSATYTYRARNNYNSGANYSEWSNAVTVTTQASAPPSTLPTGLYVIALLYTGLRIDWTANGGATTHRVQVDFNGADWTSPVYDVNVADSSGKPRIVGGLLSGTDYQVRVSADNGTNWTLPVYVMTGTQSDNGGTCVFETANVTLVDHIDNVYEVPANTVIVGSRLKGRNALTGEPEIAAVKGIVKGVSNGLCHVTTEKGYKLPCSLTHRIITSFNDKRGVAAEILRAGDKVLTYDIVNDIIMEDTITDIFIENGEFNVITFEMDSADHTYISEGILAHNRKINEF